MEICTSFVAVRTRLNWCRAILGARRGRVDWPHLSEGRVGCRPRVQPPAIVIGASACSVSVQQALTPQQESLVALASPLLLMVGLMARTMAECMPAATEWVGLSSMFVKPVASRLWRYSAKGVAALKGNPRLC